MSVSEVRRRAVAVLRRFTAIVFGLLLVLQAGLVFPHSQPVATAQTPFTPAQDTGSGVCGSNFALVFDLSNSLSASDVQNLKEATTEMVTSLAGAPYSVGVYTFGTAAPASGHHNLPATSLADEEGTEAVLRAIGDVRLPGGNHGGTNWDRGLEQVANDMASGIKYDTVYFITDGTPTYDRNGANRAGNSTEITEITEAVEQSNRIARLGGKVIPVGAGSDTQWNREVPVYEWRPWLFWGSWEVHSYVERQEMLSSIATSGESPIIQGYEELPELMSDKVVTGCLQVVKNIVDGDGNVIRKGDGWSFGLKYSEPLEQAPGSLTTGSDGIGEVSVANIGIDNPVSVTITEENRNGFELSRQGDNNAQCMAYQYGSAPTPVDIRNVGSLGVSVDLDPRKVISCTFNNAPIVPVKLTKQVEIADSQLQNELNNRTYDFSYVCRRDGMELGSGDATGVKPGNDYDLGSYPLGTECEVTEHAPEVDAARFTVSTTWSQDNAGVVSTSEDGLTHTIRPTGDAYLGGSGARVRALNTFEARTGTITLRKNIVDEHLLPQERIPDRFPVKYFCRYVPDPDNVPEQDGDPGNPYHVADGHVFVDRNGSVDLGPFPVGTQCGFEEVAPDDAPDAGPGIPGFSLRAEWNSDICLRKDDSAGGGLDKCESNFVRIPEAGAHNLEVSNTYTRQTGSLELNKAVEGDAADAGTGLNYSFDVRCTDGGQEVFNQTGIPVAVGAGTRVEGIPVAADCVVSEQTPEIDNIDVTVPAPQTVRLEGPNQNLSVTLVNTLTYRTGTISLTKSVDLTEITDDDTYPSLLGESFPVTATCRVPGEDTPRVFTDTMRDGSAFIIPDVPLGTSCTFVENYTAPDGVDHSALFSTGSPTVTLTSEAGAGATLQNVFRPDVGDIRVTKYVDATLVPADLEPDVPTTFTVDYQCIIGGAGSLTLGAGETGTIPGVQVGDTCTFTELQPLLPAGLEQTVTWSARGDSHAGDSFTVSVPPTSGGVGVTLNNAFEPTFSEVRLAKQLDFRGADGQPVSPTVLKALTSTPPRFTVDYQCVRNGAVVTTGVTAVSETESPSLQVPTGATCTFTERPSIIPGTTGPEITYTGGDQTSDGSTSVDLVIPGELRDLVVTNTYDVQYGSFNLKKKVDGEGVATVAPERQYELRYRCTLNEVEVASGTQLMGRFDSGDSNQVTGIPTGAECSVVETPSDEYGAEEPHAQWTARWTVADGPTGFENEQVCANQEGCETTPRRNEVTVTIPTTGEDNFLGTLVVWNTYVYDKVSLSVDKVLAGDGPALAGNDDFSFALVCTDPAFADSGLGELPYVQDPTQRASFTITGAGRQDGVLEVPVGYQCDLVEQQVDGYDAVVTTQFEERPGVEVTDSQDPTQEDGAAGKFTTLAEFANSEDPQLVTVTNHYERPRADVRLVKSFGEHPNSVSEWLTTSNFPMSWTCTDPFATQEISGNADVPAGGDHLIENLPASAVCAFSENVSGQFPERMKEVVNTAHRVEVTQGGETLGIHNSPTVDNVTLIPAGTTDVSFTNTYWVDQVQLRVTKIVEGDPGNTILGNEFEFSYQCEFPNLLPEQPAPMTKEGSFTVTDGNLWSTPNLPIGSSCAVTEVSPEPEGGLPDGWRLQPNYIYPTGDAPITYDEYGNLVIPEDVYADEVRIPLSEGEKIHVGGDKASDAVVFNSLYRTDGEVQVLKVNPDGEPLSGASFSIYPADDSGEMAAEPLVDKLEYIVDAENPGVADESRFTTRLGPGTYFLVETKAGEQSQLLPRQWQFSVKPGPEDGEIGHLKFVLESSAQHSGLVELIPPQPAEGEELTGTEPWVIKVANVEQGEMPLTGGRGVTGLIAGGLVLLLLAGIWRNRTRQRS
ncbi:DUF5979 domain-containing protein [Corynebacterium casei]|uniref:DUF5979 domain-containing protein n=1 Tax=Corynebacterium casei TaxID=160386 RepID=UPI003BB6F99C